jgi:S1-C subfamily serine protease
MTRILTLLASLFLVGCPQQSYQPLTSYASANTPHWCAGADYWYARVRTGCNAGEKWFPSEAAAIDSLGESHEQVWCSGTKKLYSTTRWFCDQVGGKSFSDQASAEEYHREKLGVEPSVPTPTPTPLHGTLAIRGIGQSVGADVCVNKKYRGLLPIDLMLIPGTYSVRIEKDSKLSVERQITLEAGKTKYWYVGLRPGVRINKCGASTPEPQPTPAPQPTPTYRLIGTGTGFAVNKKYVVTAEHVLEECNAVSIAHAHEEISAQTVARDKNNDLGLLKIEKPMANTAKLRDSPDLRVGDTAINYGYPLFGELSDSAKLNAGYVNSLAGYDNNSGVIQYSAPTQPGNSGGPVLDQSGNVIGVVSSGLSKRYAEESGHIAQNVNFAIKSTILEGFLKANKVPFEKADSTEELKLPDIAEKAERFTVLVGCWE